MLSSFVAGVVFAVGLGVAGMTQADKVIAFLDIAGNWDPSLALVMGGAIAVHLLLFKLILRRPSPILGTHFGLPTRTDIDGRLVGGAALFGIGWALGGYCPGPGIVSAAGGTGHALAFLGAMTGGMLLFHVAHTAWLGRTARGITTQAPPPTTEPAEATR